MPDRSRNDDLDAELEAGLEEFDDEGEIDPAFYAHGGVSLSEAEREALGDLNGKKVLVLGIGPGEDSLSLHNLGADVTVADDEEAIIDARELIDETGIELHTVECPAWDIDQALRDRSFDVVYSPFASLGWIPSLADWASGISGALRPGGRLVIYDEHPISHVFGEGLDPRHLYVSTSYFGEVVEWEFDEILEEDEEDLGPELAGPLWTLGQIVNALGECGMAIVSLHEFPESDRYETSIDALVDVDYDEASRIPAVMLMVAIKLPE